MDVNNPGAVTAERNRNAVPFLVGIGMRPGQVWIDKRPVDIRAVQANIERLAQRIPKVPLSCRPMKGPRTAFSFR